MFAVAVSPPTGQGHRLIRRGVRRVARDDGEIRSRNVDRVGALRSRYRRRSYHFCTVLHNHVDLGEGRVRLRVGDGTADRPDGLRDPDRRRGVVLGETTVTVVSPVPNPLGTVPLSETVVVFPGPSETFSAPRALALLAFPGSTRRSSTVRLSPATSPSFVTFTVVVSGPPRSTVSGVVRSVTVYEGGSRTVIVDA